MADYIAYALSGDIDDNPLEIKLKNNSLAMDELNKIWLPDFIENASSFTTEDFIHAHTFTIDVDEHAWAFDFDEEELEQFFTWLAPHIENTDQPINVVVNEYRLNNDIHLKGWGRNFDNNAQGVLDYLAARTIYPHDGDVHQEYTITFRDGKAHVA